MRKLALRHEDASLKRLNESGIAVGLVTLFTQAIWHVTPSKYTRDCRVESHESCRIKSLDAACFIFVTQTPVIGHDGRNGCTEAYFFS